MYIKKHIRQIDYNNEEEVLNLQRDIQSTSKSLKEVAESQKQGIGISDDFEPRDDDIVSQLSEDSKMTFQTDGDQLTEKDINSIMSDKHLEPKKIRALYMKIKNEYKSIPDYVERVDIARLRNIVEVKVLLEKLESYKEIQSKENIEKELRWRIHGKKNQGNITIRKQPTLKKYIGELKEELDTKRNGSSREKTEEYKWVTSTPEKATSGKERYQTAEWDDILNNKEKNKIYEEIYSDEDLREIYSDEDLRDTKDEKISEEDLRDREEEIIIADYFDSLKNDVSSYFKRLLSEYTRKKSK